MKYILVFSFAFSFPEWPPFTSFINAGKNVGIHLMGFMERPLPHHPQLVLFLEFRLPDPPVEWATGLKLSQIQLKILTVCIHFLFMKGTGLLLTLLGYGEIKGDTFPDDDVDQGKKCNGCICNVFGWRKHSMSMYFSCICYHSVFALLLLLAL